MSSQLASMKAKQLQHLAFLTGLPSSGRKSDLVNYLTISLQQQCLPPKRRRVLSVDMGIRNLAFCVLDVPNASSTGKPDSIDNLHVHMWKRLDLLQQPDASILETTPRAEAKKTTGRVRKRASQANSVPKDAFTPSALSKTAFKITQDLLSHKPTTILIERQRFRSGGGSAIQEWTVRVNMLESMLWACLETHKNSHPTKAAADFPSMHEVSPSRVSKFWTAGSDAELRPSDDVLEDRSASLDKLSSPRKVDKAEKIAVRASLLRPTGLSFYATIPSRLQRNSPIHSPQRNEGSRGSEALRPGSQGGQDLRGRASRGACRATAERKTTKSAHAEEVSHLDAGLPSDAHDATPSDVEEYEAPKKRAKKSSKKYKMPGKVDANGIRRLDTTEKCPPGERRPPQMWAVPKNPVKLKDVKGLSLATEMTDTFEDRYRRQVSKIKRLDPAQEEYRQKREYVSHEAESYETFLECANTQRLVILGRSHDNEESCHAHHDDCPYHKVKIAESPGNVYTVIISHIPSCSCPNTSFKAKNSGEALCKHILYVLHHVLKAQAHLCYQNAFMISELKEITASAPALPVEIAQEDSMDGKRKLVEDDCPICCINFDEEGEDSTWCRAACGNNIHNGCFDQWAKTKRGGTVTCPFCRTEWEAESKKQGGRSANMAGVKLPAVRDRSGYYNAADQFGDEL